MSSILQETKDIRSLKTFVAYPESDALRPDSEDVSDFLAYCLEVKSPGGYARREDFNPELLRPWLGHIMILEFLPEQDDFRYRMYGTIIAIESGFDMTGKLVSAFQSETGDFFRSLYREAVDRREIIFTGITGVHAENYCDWYRVICPTQHNQSTQIVACNYSKVRRNTT